MLQTASIATDFGSEAHESTTFAALLREVARLGDQAEARVLAPGDSVLDGRFAIERLVGRGGMGTVYEATDRDLDARVALKTLRIDDPELIVRFKHEFRTMAELVHPNLVRPGELLEDGGLWFFTMELVHGVDFLRWVGLDQERLRYALLELADVLEALHRQKLVHRDVKPSNIVISNEGRLVLLDLGLARDALRPLWLDTDKVGTALYMAPELAAGAAAGPAADWYAVGVMLHQALTGEAPLIAANVELSEVKVTSPISPRPRRHDATEGLSGLCRDLLAANPEQRPSGKDVLRALSAGGKPRVEVGAPRREIAEIELFGREAELALLHDALIDVEAGRPACVYVYGASGVGKSALVASFLASLAPDPNTLVLRGRCHERESVPFKAFDGVVDDLTAQLGRRPASEVRDLLSRDGALLAQTFPALRTLASTGDALPSEAPTQEHRKRVFAAFRRLIGRLAGSGRVVLFIDDVQWADEDGLSLLRQLLKRPDAPPVLLIASSRQGRGAAPFIGVDTRFLSLGTLADEAATRLSRTLLRERGLDEALAGALVGESGGHPLHLAELVRHVSETGDRERVPRLDDAIVSRSERLDERGRELLSLIVLAAVPITGAVLRAAGAWSGEELSRLLDLLRRAHFITAWSDRSGKRHAVQHDRVREALGDRIGSRERLSLHARLARAFEAAEPDNAEALAVHHRGAGERERARGYALRAARLALESLAFDHAAELFGMAIELDPGAADRGRIRVELADALAAAARPSEAAWEYLDAANDPDLRPQARRRAAEQLLLGGHTEQGLLLLDEVLKSLGLPAGVQALKAPAEVGRAIDDLISGAGPSVTEQRELDPGDRERLEFFWFAASALALVDDARAGDLHALLCSTALGSGDPSQIARAIGLEGCLRATNVGDARSPRGNADFDGTRRMLDRGRELFGAGMDPIGFAMMSAGAMMLDFNLGHWERFIAMWDGSRHVLSRLPRTTWMRDSVCLYGLLSEFHLGKVRSLRLHWQEAHEDAIERGDRFLEHLLDAFATPVLHLLNARPEAATQVVEAIEGRFWAGGVSHVSALRAIAVQLVSLYTRRYRQALDPSPNSLLANSLSFARRSHYTRLLADGLEGALCMGALAEARSEDERRALQGRAEARLESLVESLVPWANPHRALLRAQICVSRGALAEAADDFELAAQEFAAQGAELMAAVARLAFSKLGANSSAAEPMDFMQSQGIAEPLSLAAAFCPFLQRSV